MAESNFSVLTGRVICSHLVLLMLAQAVQAEPDVIWNRDFGASSSSLELRVSSGLGDDLIVSGHTPGHGARGFVGSMYATNGSDSIRRLTMSGGHRTRYWDLDADSGVRGSPDYIVTVGIGQRTDEVKTSGGIIHIYKDKRPDSTGWNMERGIHTDYFQILAVAGLDAQAGHFLVGAGGFNPESDVGGYDGALAIYDLDGNMLWHETIHNGVMVNIHDMILNGGILYVVGGVSGYLEGEAPIGAMDGFIRAYRVGRIDPARGYVPQHLWTRRFATGWSERNHDVSGGLLAVASDRAGNVYIAGETRVTSDATSRLLADFEDDPSVYTYGGWITSFVAKFDSSGNRIWAKHIGASDNTVARAIVADCAGNVWIAGATQGVFRGETRNSDEPHGGFIIRMDADGHTIWADSSVLRGRLGARDEPWYIITGLDLDANGTLYAAGSFANRWGPVAGDEGSGFVAGLNDRESHYMGVRGFSACPASTSARIPPPAGRRCPKPPDAQMLVQQGGASVPHEGFRGDATCSNGWDDDHDGLCDAEDPDCRQTQRDYEGTTGCLPRGPDIPPAAERFPSPLCNDGIDNDGNGRCDHGEPACASDFGRVDVPRQQTTVPMTVQQADKFTCRDAVNGQIAWDYRGSKSWAPRNVERLCNRAETSVEPARCFERVMHGRVNWGKSTQWHWEDALRLCAGSLNTNKTVGCFEKQIAAKATQDRAIEVCKRK